MMCLNKMNHYIGIFHCNGPLISANTALQCLDRKLFFNCHQILQCRTSRCSERTHIIAANPENQDKTVHNK